MKCSRCAEQPVAYLRHMGQHLCRYHFLKVFEVRIKKRIMNKKLFTKDDKIRVIDNNDLDSKVLIHYLNKKHYKFYEKGYTVSLVGNHLECELMNKLSAFIEGKKLKKGIHPLAECPEEETTLYAELEGIKYKKRTKCAATKMEKQLLKLIEETDDTYPGSKFKLLASFEKL